MADSIKYERISLTVPSDVRKTLNDLRAYHIRQHGTFSLSSFLTPHIQAVALDRLSGAPPDSRPIPKRRERVHSTLDDFRDSRTEATPPLMSDSDVIHSFLGRLRDHNDPARFEAVGKAIAAWQSAYRSVDRERLVARTLNTRVEGPSGPSAPIVHRKEGPAV